MGYSVGIRGQLYLHEQLITITWRDGTVTPGMISLGGDIIKILHNREPGRLQYGHAYFGPHEYKSEWSTNQTCLEMGRSKQIESIGLYCNKPRD